MPTRTVSSEVIAKWLEHGGWLRSIAGEEEFDKAVAAIDAMFKTGRGLFMTGAAGCGKTQLMRALKSWLNKESVQWIYCKCRDDLDYMRSNCEDCITGNVYVDDIGCEEIVKEYGNTIDIVGDYIQRYHYRGTGRFFATTNLDSQAINERYGTRCLDRILEMCVVLKFSGKTKRERVVFQ